MNVKHAKDAARAWVMEEASKLPNFYGAFFIGSINEMADEAEFPLISDIDVTIVLDEPEPAFDLRRIPYQGFILETSNYSSSRFQSPDLVLGNYPLARHFIKPNILADPTGQLTRIQPEVAKYYAHRVWVRKRVEDAQNWLIEWHTYMKETDPLPDQVFYWLYGAMMPNHVVLVADLKNPTVRKALVAAREVLNAYGEATLYGSILSNFGFAEMSIVQVERHLAACIEVFDVAKGVVKTPFIFSHFISDLSRPMLVQGSRQLIEFGHYREAMMWIAWVSTICQRVLSNDALPDIQQQFASAYQQLLAELGVNSIADVLQRVEQTKSLVPRLWDAAEKIMAANPAMVD